MILTCIEVFQQLKHTVAIPVNRSDIVSRLSGQQSSLDSPVRTSCQDELGRLFLGAMMTAAFAAELLLIGADAARHQKLAGSRIGHGHPFVLVSGKMIVTV